MGLFDWLTGGNSDGNAEKKGGRLNPFSNPFGTGGASGYSDRDEDDEYDENDDDSDDDD